MKISIIHSQHSLPLNSYAPKLNLTICFRLRIIQFTIQEMALDFALSKARAIYCKQIMFCHALYHYIIV